MSNLITQTITHPDQILTHKNDKYKKSKKFNIKRNSHTKQILTHKNDKYKKKVKNLIKKEIPILNKYLHIKMLNIKRK